MQNLSIGDIVKVECVDHAKIVQDGIPKTITGKIESIFNAFDAQGDNWIIEIKTECRWFLYKPRFDGGTVTVLVKSKI